MGPSTHLTGLTTREAIADALYRAVLGIDTNDLPLFKSACVDLKDFTFAINNSEMAGEMTGEDFVLGKMFNSVGPMDTTHTISNIRIDVRGEEAEEASMTCHAVAQHYRKGEGPDPSTKKLVSGGIYDVELVKDGSDGLWKMKRWALNLVWREGDAEVMAGR